MFKLDEVIAGALHVLGQGASDRYPTPRLLVHANSGIMRLVELRPSLFHVEAWVDLAEGVYQEAATRELVGVLEFKRGTEVAAVRPLDITSLSSWLPEWRSSEPDLPRQAVITGQQTFQVYPPADEACQVRIRHVSVPAAYGQYDDVQLSREYLPALSDYVAGMAEMADEEHVNSGRAATLLAAFGNAIMGVKSGKPG